MTDTWRITVVKGRPPDSRGGESPGSDFSGINRTVGFVRGGVKRRNGPRRHFKPTFSFFGSFFDSGLWHGGARGECDSGGL
jgi:hypothetical protein